MSKESQTSQNNPALTSSENGNGMYLLFVDLQPPSRHDLLVSDFSGAFASAHKAMEWYEKRYQPYGEPQALIARFNGAKLEIIYRAVVYGEEDHVDGHPCWAYAYDMEEDDNDEM